MSFKKEVVIIGAGVVGCSIAFHLAKRGIPSQVIEMDSIAARASGKSWAILGYPSSFFSREQYSPDDLAAMPQGSIEPWLDLIAIGYFRMPELALELKEQPGIDIGFSEFPYLHTARSEDEEKELKADIASQKSEGYYQNEWLDEKDVKSIYPDIDPAVKGAVCSICFQYEPYKYVIALAQAAEKMGATFRQGQAIGFERKATKVTSVILASGTKIDADVFVLATGPWISQTTSCLGKQMPVIVVREQCVKLEVDKRLPPYALDSNLPGGIMSIVIIPHANGQIIIGHNNRNDIQPNCDVIPLTEEEKYSQLTDAINLLPRLKEARVVEHRGDFEGWSPPPYSIRPVLGRLPEWDNVYVAARMGTLGHIMNLGTGHCMAELIAGEGKVPYRIKHMMEVLAQW